MFCRNCGAQNRDDATFCQSCGEPLSSAGGESAGTAGAVRPAKKPNFVLIGIVAVIVVVVVALFMLMGGRSEKDVVEKIINVYNKGDAKSIVSLIPDKVVEEICDEEDMTRKEWISELNDDLENMRDELDDEYDKWKITYKIVDTDEYSKKELRDLKETYEDNYDAKVKDAKKISVKLTLEGDGDKESNTIEIPVIKIGRSWYLDSTNIRIFY